VPASDSSCDGDAQGDISSGRLDLPNGTTMPSQLKAYVIADVFQLRVKQLH
jgi:hypothetical protein